MAAGVIKAPELNLSPAEAKQIVSATQKVGKHYNVAVSEKTAAWVNLAMCIGAIYGSRIIAVAVRRKKEPKNNVVPFPTPTAAATAAPTENADPATGPIDWNKQMQGFLNPSGAKPHGNK